jgi:hypothetical protein
MPVRTCLILHCPISFIVLRPFTSFLTILTRRRTDTRFNTMPRTWQDARPARALLSAPYPLPYIVTRSPTEQPPLPPVPPIQAHQPSLTPDTCFHAPIPNPNDTSSPSCQVAGPRPPLAQFPFQRKWRVRLSKPAKRNGESSDVELMSGIEETGPSRDLLARREIGSWSLPAVQESASGVSLAAPSTQLQAPSN